ncbi:unnamed protein product [Trifolium pratense]|uniref:Uncharacterized protein n=1 Tax=Trifolium pratense TaxID=57577 RepID=A0ACB0LCW1_TRIPR|nr:unnamed protein product [Trifolium pratense]
MKGQSIQADTVVIDGLYKGGRLKNALKVFKILLINGYHLDVFLTYNAMINGLCKEGLFDEVYFPSSIWKRVDILLCETIARGLL